MAPMAIPAEQQQTLALAAVMQAVHAVRQVAHTGHREETDYRPLVEGLLGAYDGSVEALYGGAAHLDTGLRRLVEQLEQPRNLETTRYVANVLHLERRLLRNRKVLGEVAEGLEQARRQADYFGTPIHESVIRGLGELYSNTISRVGPRVMVQGERQHLEDEGNAALLRTLLLAGIRAATLWREQGGGRLKLIFRRQRISRAARDLLAPAQRLP